MGGGREALDSRLRGNDVGGLQEWREGARERREVGLRCGGNLLQYIVPYYSESKRNRQEHPH